jgi:hypothetical protein
MITIGLCIGAIGAVALTLECLGVATVLIGVGVVLIRLA